MTRFYDVTARSRFLGESLTTWALDRFGRQGLAADRFALTLLPFDAPLDAGGSKRPEGFGYHGDQPFYPCSVVKLFYLAAAHRRLEDGAVLPHAELERAMTDMIRWSSNTATNYVIDIVSGVTGDTLLDEAEMRAWVERRLWINRWLAGLGWPQTAPINVCQKLMDDDRYGREKAFVRLGGNNHNRLTTDVTARILHAVFTGSLVSAERSRAMAQAMRRPLTPDFIARPGAQVLGYFGQGLSEGARLWSKAGWTGWTGDPEASYRRHDAAYVEMPDGRAFILVAFTQGKETAERHDLLPAIASRMCELMAAREACHEGAPSR